MAFVFENEITVVSEGCTSYAIFMYLLTFKQSCIVIAYKLLHLHPISSDSKLNNMLEISIYSTVIYLNNLFIQILPMFGHKLTG